MGQGPSCQCAQSQCREELERAGFKRMVLSQAAVIQLHRSLECSLWAVKKSCQEYRVEREVDLTAGASGGYDAKWCHIANPVEGPSLWLGKV